MNFKTLLLDWYDKYKRSFPWREHAFKNSDEHAYHTLVCEVMSQQTLLSVMLPKYKQFLIELPDIESLERCSEEQLRALWKGLGYYARARNLQKGAHFICKKRNGVFPKTQKEWEEIPGCGPYTSSIIASICYHEKSVAVDGNIIRVVSRLLNMQDISVWTPNGYKQIAKYLKNHISAERPGDFNQAMMDLGATVCKKYEPNCSTCPLSNHCLAYQYKTIELCPPTKPRKTQTSENIFVVIIQNPDNKNEVCLLERHQGFLKRTIGFPLFSQSQGWSIDSICSHISACDGTANVLKNTFKHSITHYKITGYAILIEDHKNNFQVQKFVRESSPQTKIQWINKHGLKNHLSSSLDQKVHKLFF